MQASQTKNTFRSMEVHSMLTKLIALHLKCFRIIPQRENKLNGIAILFCVVTLCRFAAAYHRIGEISSPASGLRSMEILFHYMMNLVALYSG